MNRTVKNDIICRALKTEKGKDKMSMDRGLVFIISGPAGTGKGTVVNKLRELLPSLGVSVSATTRAPRPGEADGVNYHFISREHFENLIENGGVLEFTEYCGNYYGTLRSEADRILNEGRDLLLEIEVEGALNIKRMIPNDSIAIMLMAPTPAELERRLRDRGTETDEVIRRRLRRSAEEIAEAEHYDYAVINETGRIDECANEIASIIASEHRRISRMRSVIDEYASYIER